MKDKSGPMLHGRVWMNERGELFPVLPYYTLFDKEPIELEYEGSHMYFGTIFHVGWLVQNRHGVSFVLGLNIKDNFEDLGEL